MTTLKEKEKQLLARAIAFYYRNHVWGSLRDEDANKAAQEHFDLRHFCKSFGIWEFLPEDIHRGN